MKHYDYAEWLFYKSKSLSNEKIIEMENHLFQCEDCMDIFLSLIDEKEIAKAEALIAEDFNQKVLKKVKNIIPINKKIRSKRSINDIFIYYAAVASVAIILTGTGVFTSIVDSVPEITVSISDQEEFKGNKIYDFSETIADKTSIFLNNFQVSKRRIEDESKK